MKIKISKSEWDKMGKQAGAPLLEDKFIGNMEQTLNRFLDSPDSRRLLKAYFMEHPEALAEIRRNLNNALRNRVEF